MHSKTAKKYNKVTCTQDISLQIQNSSSDAVIVNSSLHQLRIDNPSGLIIGPITMKSNQEYIRAIKRHS